LFRLYNAKNLRKYYDYKYSVFYTIVLKSLMEIKTKSTGINLSREVWNMTRWILNDKLINHEFESYTVCIFNGQRSTRGLASIVYYYYTYHSGVHILR